ncbi:MAG: CoA-binding protein [Rubripirellula sp.]
MNDIDTFLAASTFAVAGASNDRDKYGNKVLRAYLQNGFAVIPIHPRESMIEGQTAYPSLTDSPSVESLSIVTPPAVTELIVEQAIEMGVKHIWMQSGAENQSAIDRAAEAGLTVIAGGPCILVALNYREET